MNRRALLVSTAALSLSPAATFAAGLTPPKTPKRPLRIEQLGRVRVDDYAWLKPANWKEVWRDTSTLDPAIRAYLAEENAYCDAVLAPTQPLRDALFNQMKARTAPELQTPPTIDGAFAYVTRFAPGAQYPRHLRRPAAGGEEVLLLDEAARAQGHAFFHVAAPGPSPDGRLFVWGEDVAGSEKYVLYLKDLATGQVTEGPHDAFGTFALTPDSEWLFWTYRDAQSRPSRIYRRPAKGGADVLVYEEKDPGFLLTVTLAASGSHLVIRSWNDVESEVRLVDVTTPAAPPKLVAARQAGHLYSVEPWGERAVILTNDNAVDFRLMTAPLKRPERANWSELVAHKPGRTITEIRAFAGGLVRLERVEGNLSVVIRQADGRETTLAFTEPAYLLTMAPSDYDGALRLTYESPRTPKTWLAADLATGRRVILARQPVPAYRPADYEVRRIHARAADGAEIPITLLHKKGLKLNGRAPLLLTGYGSYGASYETGFSIPNLALVDQGFIWAVAHVRGGSEKGRDWFEQARQLNKKISFTDFIACAETLIATRHTAKGRIVLHGFSAGGLLTGAALNLRPDLFGAVIGQAPFVDMLNTMSDASHPLVPLTRPVWGDPLADPAAYDYIAGYSPYENVAARPYPPVLATTAIGDDRVGFWEPAKWIAALREKSTSGAPMLLHTEMTSGHVGAGGRFDELAQMARMYAFAVSSVQARR